MPRDRRATADRPADDHPVVREGLKKLIAALPDMEVVGEVRDGAEAFKAAAQLSLDLIILDLMSTLMTVVTQSSVRKGN